MLSCRVVGIVWSKQNSTSTQMHFLPLFSQPFNSGQWLSTFLIPHVVAPPTTKLLLLSNCNFVTDSWCKSVFSGSLRWPCKGVVNPTGSQQFENHWFRVFFIDICSPKNCFTSKSSNAFLRRQSVSALPTSVYQDGSQIAEHHVQLRVIDLSCQIWRLLHIDVGIIKVALCIQSSSQVTHQHNGLEEKAAFSLQIHSHRTLAWRLLHCNPPPTHTHSVFNFIRIPQN